MLQTPRNDSLHGSWNGDAVMLVRQTSFGLLIFIGASSLANITNAESLRSYHCSNVSSVGEALNCPIGCREAISGLHTEFKVDARSRSVMVLTKLSSPVEGNGKTFPRGHVLNSDVMENCKIFDKNNWDCSTADKPIDNPQMGFFFANGYYRRMTDGIYKSFNWVEETKGRYSERSKRVVGGAGCALPFGR